MALVRIITPRRVYDGHLPSTDGISEIESLDFSSPLADLDAIIAWNQFNELREKSAEAAMNIVSKQS